MSEPKGAMRKAQMSGQLVNDSCDADPSLYTSRCGGRLQRPHIRGVFRGGVSAAAARGGQGCSRQPHVSRQLRCQLLICTHCCHGPSGQCGGCCRVPGELPSPSYFLQEQAMGSGCGSHCVDGQPLNVMILHAQEVGYDTFISLTW